MTKTEIPNKPRVMNKKKKRMISSGSKVKTTKRPSGNSRAAQNKKIRQDALREELKAREYLRQLTDIEQRLNPEHKKTYNPEDLPKIKERTGILFKLLDKCLPNLRPVDIPIMLNAKDTLRGTGQEIIDSMINGAISAQEASSLMSAITAQIRVVEVEDLTKRIEELEEKA